MCARIYSFGNRRIMEKLYTQTEIDELEKEFKRTSAQFLSAEDLKRFFKSKYELLKKPVGVPGAKHLFDLFLASDDDEYAFDLWHELYFDNNDNLLITDKSAEIAWRSLYPKLN